jgi:hypothetical protein
MRWGAPIAVVVALLLLAATPDVQAQGWRTQMLRPTLSTFFFNGGETDKHWPGGAGILGANYPSVYSWGYGRYGSIRVSRFSHNFRAIHQSQRMGSGIWIFTNDGASKRVVYTGP